MVELFKQEMLKMGYKASVVSINHLKDLEEEIEKISGCGYIDRELYHWLRTYYKFNPPESRHEIASLVIVASRSPQVKIFFHWKGRQVFLMMPPTYLDFNSEPERIEKVIDQIPHINQYHFSEARNLPNKILAAKSGMGAYGRNNLLYVPGLGSMHLLSVFYSDLPCSEDGWNEIQLMNSCKKCSACLDHCPTGAINTERFTIKAERCITFHNEFWGKPEFPEWIDPAAHNSIVGCMDCQRICPMNKDHLNNVIELAGFDAGETDIILQKKAREDLSHSLVSKLEAANLYAHYDYLARNLKVLLEKG